MISIPKREKYLPNKFPRYRHPEWLPKPQRIVSNQYTNNLFIFLRDI